MVTISGEISTYYVAFKGQLYLWVLSLWRWSNYGSEKWARHAEGRLHVLLTGNQQTNISKEALWLSLASSKVTALSGGRAPRLVVDGILYGVWRFGFEIISMPGQALWPSFVQGRCEHGITRRTEEKAQRQMSHAWSRRINWMQTKVHQCEHRK